MVPKVASFLCRSLDSKAIHMDRFVRHETITLPFLNNYVFVIFLNYIAYHTRKWYCQILQIALPLFCLLLCYTDNASESDTFVTKQPASIIYILP